MIVSPTAQDGIVDGVNKSDLLGSNVSMYAGQGLQALGRLIRFIADSSASYA